MNTNGSSSSESGAPKGTPASRGLKGIIFPCAVLLGATVAAYASALLGGFIWDDDVYVTENAALETVAGLKAIWLELGATPQYYPLVHTSFWIERRLWGLQPFGFHLVNVALHGGGAALLWLILRRLSIKGAWLAAAIFALHPVHVESVAWITERKNVLSGVFYLGAGLAYLRFYRLGEPDAAARRSWGTYALALVLFAAALLSKTVTATLPAAILLVLWFRRGRIGLRDLAPLVPFFALGVPFGLMTVWIEKYHLGGEGAGAWGEAWDFSWIERCLIAGRALWFYAGKIIAPMKLTFIYPRWEIDGGAWLQYAFPLSAIALVAALWAFRGRIGRGPATACLFFAGTLFPALGFLNVYPMRFSFVADHFQYLASIGLIVPAAFVISLALERTAGERRVFAGAISLKTVCVFMMLLTLGGLTLKGGWKYQSEKTIWADTLAKNPNAWIARHNLATILLAEGRAEEAIEHFKVLLERKPDLPEMRHNLGLALYGTQRKAEAVAQFREAIALEPSYVDAYNSLGVTLSELDRADEAYEIYNRAIAIAPEDSRAYVNLGNISFAAGRSDEAIQAFARAMEINPTEAGAWNGMGSALASRGSLDEAITHFTRALELDPGDAMAQANLARARAMLNQRRSP